MIYLVGGALEPWNFMTFHSVGNVIGPQLTNSLHYIIQRGWAQTTNHLWMFKPLVSCFSQAPAFPAFQGRLLLGLRAGKAALGIHP